MLHSVNLTCSIIIISLFKEGCLYSFYSRVKYTPVRASSPAEAHLGSPCSRMRYSAPRSPNPVSQGSYSASQQRQTEISCSPFFLIQQPIQDIPSVSSLNHRSSPPFLPLSPSFPPYLLPLISTKPLKLRLKFLHLFSPSLSLSLTSLQLSLPPLLPAHVNPQVFGKSRKYILHLFDVNVREDQDTGVGGPRSP